MPPNHFFLIDVSHTAVTTGVTTAACASIQRILDDLQGKLSSKFGTAKSSNVRASLGKIGWTLLLLPVAHQFARFI